MAEPNAEYWRRGAFVTRAERVKQSASFALKRLEQQSHAPQWLVHALRGILEMADPLPCELKLWRDAARAEKETEVIAKYECAYCKRKYATAEVRNDHQDQCDPRNALNR